MVLQSNFAKRPFPKRNVSNAENKPLAPTASSLLRRKHSSLLRHRARVAKLSNDVHAARQSRAKAAKQLKFTMKTVVTQQPAATPDVEMADATPSTSSSLKPISITLPKELQRPDFPAISSEALDAVDPNLKDVDITYLRESLDMMGPAFYKTLCQVQPPPSFTNLPKELNITVNDWEPTFVFPSHVLAIFGPEHQNQGSSTSNSKPDKVLLYPVHSLLLASYCSQLPAFPSIDQKYEHQPPRKVTSTVPVVPMRLPSPSTYKSLFCYLYTKRADVLLTSLLPAAPPSNLLYSLLPMSKPLINPFVNTVSSVAPKRRPISKSTSKPQSELDDIRPAVSPPPVAQSPTPTPTSAPQPPTSTPAPAPTPSAPLSQEDEDSQIALDHRKAVFECSTRLAATYTTQALVQHLLRVHGLYLNVCALGISEEGLWETIGCAWEMLLAAVAIGRGQDIDGILGPEPSS